MLSPPTLIGSLVTSKSLEDLLNVQRPSCCHYASGAPTLFFSGFPGLWSTCLGPCARQWSSHFCRKNTSELPGRAFQCQASWCSCAHRAQDRILGFILALVVWEGSKLVALSWSLRHPSFPLCLLWSLGVPDIPWAEPWEGVSAPYFEHRAFLKVTLDWAVFWIPDECDLLNFVKPTFGFYPRVKFKVDSVSGEACYSVAVS